MNEGNQNMSTFHLINTYQCADFHYQYQQFKHFQLTEALKIYSENLDSLKLIHYKNTTINTLYGNLVETLLKLLIKENEAHAKVSHKIGSSTDQNLYSVENDEPVTRREDEIGDMKAKYESKIQLLSNNLQETIEVLENNFKEQLLERQNLVRELLKLLNDKNAEFAEYISTLNEDNDRKIIKLKIEYEQQLRDEREENSKLQSEIGVLMGKLKYAKLNIDDLEKDKSHLLRDHAKNKETMQQFEADIEELRRDISKNDENMSRKENYINTLDKQNQDLEKYKEILNKKVADIKLQNEPILIELKNRNEEILNLKNDIEKLKNKQGGLQLQVDNLKLKVHGGECQLKDEIERRQMTQIRNQNISRGIFELTEKLGNVLELKKGIVNLYHKYSTP